MRLPMHAAWTPLVAVMALGPVVPAEAQGDTRAPAAPVAGPAKRLTLEAAQQKLETSLFAGKLEKRALYAHPELRARGSRIAGWLPKDELLVAKDSWFFFVDEAPGANWEHPARWVTVDAETGAVSARAARTPPAEIPTLRALNPAATAQLEVMKLNASHLLAQELVRAVLVPKKNKYAVLVSGGWNASSNYGRYWNDLQSIYKTLKQKYNFTDEEIIVLYANGTHSPNADFDGDGSDDVDYSAKKTNLTTVLQHVASHLKNSGTFFFYSTNHGGQETGHDAILYLWGETIKDDELAALVKPIKAKNAIHVQEQCFSGGMMDDLLTTQPHPCNSPRVCVMTAARWDEVSWGADTEGEYDEYVYHWTAAVAGKTPSGTPVNADTNGDGTVSMNEAHNYAKAHDSQNEHPQIGSCATSACDASLLVSADVPEDCVSFNPATAAVKKVATSWKIVDGSHYMFDFGGKQAEATKALAIIKHYKLNQSCFVGRPDPSFKYLLVSGAAPSGAMAGEDCISFNPATAAVQQISGSWKIVDGSHWMFDFGAKQSEAEEALSVIKREGFSQSCFVGRPSPSFEYLRK